MLFPNCFKAANASCIHASYIIHTCTMHHTSYIIRTCIMHHASCTIHHTSYIHASYIIHTCIMHHTSYITHHTYMHRASSTPCSKLGKGDKSSPATAVVMSSMHSVLLKMSSRTAENCGVPGADARADAIAVAAKAAAKAQWCQWCQQGQ